MFEFERLKRKYDKLIKEALIKNKQIIIDSFKEYYSEEYKCIIEERYSKTIFVYYINWPAIKMAVDDIIPYFPNQDDYVDFNTFMKYCDKKDSNFFKLFKNESIKDLPNYFVGSTNDVIFYHSNLKEKLLKKFDSPSPSCFGYGDGNHGNNIVSFPILFLDESTIIHEINHSLTKDILAKVVDDNNSLDGLVIKQGLAVEHDKEKMFEELINERSSQEITNIFKNKGGNLTSFCYNIPFAYPYGYNLYLIDEFYDKFKDYIKIAKITNNKNYLIERIGKDNYYKYVELVNKYYSHYFEDVKKCKQNALDEIKVLLQQMEEKVSKSTELTNEDLNLYYEELGKQGYNVRFLNNINYDDYENDDYNDTNKKVR